MALFGRESEREKQRAEAWSQWFRRQHPLALASLVLGIFSLIEFGALIIFGVAGIVTGAIALAQLKRRALTGAGRGSPPRPPIDRVRVGAVDYASEELPPPIAASDYDRADSSPEWCEGRKLAWGGILTSVASLIVAALLYARVFG